MPRMWDGRQTWCGEIPLWSIWRWTDDTRFWYGIIYIEDMFKDKNVANDVEKEKQHSVKMIRTKTNT